MTLTRRILFTAVLGLALSAPSLAGETVNYAPNKLPKLLNSGKPLLLDFYTTWCSTCRAQQRTIAKLLNDEPAFSDVVWVKIDWDQYANSKLSKSLKIPRRSVLVMLNDGRETDRVVAQTQRSRIEKLIRSGLN